MRSSSRTSESRDLTRYAIVISPPDSTRNVAYPVRCQDSFALENQWVRRYPCSPRIRVDCFHAQICHESLLVVQCLPSLAN